MAKAAPPPKSPNPPGIVTVVVLRFRDGMLVDLVAGLSGNAAIAAASERAIRAGWSLPLLEAVTSEIPYSKLLALAGEPPAPPEPKPRPPIPIRGAVPAIAAYVKATSGPEPSIITARGALKDFFARYDCPVDFAGEREPDQEVQDEPVARKAM